MFLYQGNLTAKDATGQPIAERLNRFRQSVDVPIGEISCRVCFTVIRCRLAVDVSAEVQDGDLALPRWGDLLYAK
jgi:hypothetical protein